MKGRIVETIKRPVKVLATFRRNCRNWIPITLVYMIRRRPRVVKLREASEIRIASGMKIVNLFCLCQLLEHGWKVKPLDKSHALLVDPRGLIVKCRTDHGLDIGHLREIFLDGEYEFNMQGNVVVDIGMSNGDSSIYFASRGDFKQIIGLDPSEESFSLAEENVILNGLESKITPLNVALAPESGSAFFRHDETRTNAGSLESIDGDNLEKVRQSHGLRVPAISLPDLMSSYKLESIDVLKLDCEGSEYGIIESLPKETLQKLNEIILEFHSGMKNLGEKLEQNGFKVNSSGDSRGRGYLHAWRILSCDEEQIVLESEIPPINPLKYCVEQ